MATSDVIVDRFRYRGAQPGDVLTGVPSAPGAPSGYMVPMPGGGPLGGLWEVELVIDPDTGAISPDEAVNADGERDWVYVWRAG